MIYKFIILKSLDNNYINNENMLKELVTHNWIRKNPILASYIAFAKGILLTVLINEFIIN